MRHLRLFEGYFVDKRKELIDNFKKLKKEFEHELMPYIQMISDEFDESEVEWESGRSTGFHRVNITIKFNPIDLDKIIKAYDDFKKILDQTDFDMRFDVITKSGKFNKDIIYDYDKVIEYRKRLSQLTAKKILAVITIAEKDLGDNI